MKRAEVARYWEANAETWTRHARAGYDIYRDGLNTPAFLGMLPPVRGLCGLDIGCGEGSNTRELALVGARMHAIDVAPTFIRHARDAERAEPLGVGYLVADATDLPFAPGSFDFATAFMSIMDMVDQGRALCEAARVLRPDLWPALIDQTQIEVALLNLVINARDAMDAGGTILVGTKNVRTDERNCSDDLAPGDYVVLCVADTGEGMTAEVLAKAFEPFFTTKEIGKGTGLGLSQVYGLARQSGGTVRIRSKPGVGTEVEIYVPRALGAAKPEPPQAEAEMAAATVRRRGRVLIVDDQEEVREIAAIHLMSLG